MNVLLVEDDQNIREVLVRYLNGRGYSVNSAESAIDAFAHIDNQLPDLGIIDWDLGESLTGIDVAQYLLQSSAQTQVIFITGKSLAKLKNETSGLKIHAYLGKPFPLSEIKSALDSVQI